ncbi:hypothetical protein FACS1894204_12170 [Synergistales bacterium]|nr:hypothetical protein FACS1894204_12170 [Synergistales bacterium]
MDKKPKMSRKIVSFVSIVVFCAVFLTASWAAPSLLERAVNLYGIQDYSNALVLFDKVLETDPRNGEALDYASWCHRYLGNWETARVGFEKAKTLPGALPQWLNVGLGETLLGAGVYENAIEAFKRAIDEAPEEEELIVRSLKGISFAYASLGDSANAEETLSRLSEKDSATALDAQADVETLLESAKKRSSASAEVAATSSDAQPLPPNLYTGELSDTLDRQQKAVEQAHAAQNEQEAAEVAEVAEVAQNTQQPQDEQQPAQKDTPSDTASFALWDFAVGTPIEQVLAGLSERGIDVQKNEDETRLGTWFYTVRISGSSLLPEMTLQNAESVLCILEEFQGKLLSASASVTWRGQKGTIRLKESLFKEMSDKLDEKYGASQGLSDNGIFAEASWVTDDNRLVSLQTTASLDGQVFLCVNYNDLPSLQVFWEHIEQVNNPQQ